MSKTSGSAQTFELEWDGSQYRPFLTDETNVVGTSVFQPANPASLHGGRNQLIITAAEAPSESFTITAYKEAARRGVITWTDGNMGSGIQDVVAYAQTVSDPIQGFVNPESELWFRPRSLRQSEDGIVEGISFQITGNGVDETVQTGPNGEIQIDNLKPGEYTVTELSEDRYVPQDSQSVTVQAGQVATVEFSNILKKFTIELTKSDK
mgnify:CR=1 FL=1